MTQPAFQPNPTFADLRNEFFSRGFDYLNNGLDRVRADRWLQQAYYSICDADDWPFLTAEYGGSAPLKIPNLRTLLAVMDTTNANQLGYLDAADAAQSRDPTTEGTPEYVYVVGDTLNVYPRSPVTLSVLYLQFPTVPSDTSALIIPGRYSHAVVERAVAYAYRDDDSPELAAAAEQQALTIMEDMRNALMYPQRMGPYDWVQLYGNSDDWGGVADELL